jgi:hypothetical protein
MHIEQAPPMQNMLFPHDLPFAAGPMSVHNGCPVLHVIAFASQEFATEQSAPDMHGVHPPMLQTPPSHGVPSIAMPVCVQTCPPSAHPSTPERHIPGEHAVIAGTHPELLVEAPLEPCAIVLLVDPEDVVAEPPPEPPTNVKSPTIEAQAAELPIAAALTRARRPNAKRSGFPFIASEHISHRVTRRTNLPIAW